MHAVTDANGRPIYKPANDPVGRVLGSVNGIPVIRSDKRVKLTRDLGDARLFGEEFQLICGAPDGKGGGEAMYTVGEALQMAQDMNNMPPPKTEVRPKDWNKIFWDNVEEKNKWKRGQSTFGPLFKKERT